MAILWKELLLSINKEDRIPDDVFVEILECEDEIEKQNRIFEAESVCYKYHRAREFKALLKAWTVKAAQQLKQDGSNVTRFTDQPIMLNCGEYMADDTGITKQGIKKSGEPYTVEVCPHALLPVERMKNIDTETEKLKIAFFKDNQWSYITDDNSTFLMAHKLVSLSDRGLMVSTENSNDIVRYISTCMSLNQQEIPLYKSISRCGWVGDDFAPYMENIKYDGDIDYRPVYEAICTRGSFDEWLVLMDELRQNKIVRLLMAASFSSPLLTITGTLPYILHLWGTTGFGKTVCLMVAMSIWGNPEIGKLVRTMNMTSNSMARLLGFLCHLPFAADEMQQIKTNWNNYDSIIMFLTEGIDRGRARAYGGIEKAATWQNACIFTGEEPITKDNSGGGAKSRVIEVNVEEKIFKDGNEVVNTIKENYGHAGKVFIDFIAQYDKDKIRTIFKDYFTAIYDKFDTNEKQAISAANMLTADKLVCECLFIDDEPLTIYDIQPFLFSKKDIDITARAYEWVKSWVQRNIAHFNKQYANTLEPWGKIADGSVTDTINKVYINKSVLNEHMNKAGFDSSVCIKQWGREGLLEKNSQGKNIHQTTIEGIKTSCVSLFLEKQNSF